jgi:dienelactone hydrolase
VVVEDVLIPVAGQAPVRAFLVHPQHVGKPRSLAGVLYLHWFEPPGSNQDRGEFLAEAVAFAATGAVAVLPQLTFPWEGDPVGDARDRAAIEAQLAAVVKAYDYLLAQRGVNPHRTAVVGHDYGAMYGAILAQRRATIATAVLMAPDATWANWFDTYWLGLPDEQKPAYRAVFAGLDPVDNVSRLGSALYLQFAGRDIFVPPETRAAFAAANPAAKVSLYERSDHFLQQPAEDDRAAWLASHL